MSFTARRHKLSFTKSRPVVLLLKAQILTSKRAKTGQHPYMSPMWSALSRSGPGLEHLFQVASAAAHIFLNLASVSLLSLSGREAWSGFRVCLDPGMGRHCFLLSIACHDIYNN